MSLFKNKNQHKIQEENKIMKETILPETMTMSYSKFVSQEYDSNVDPINADLKALEARSMELGALYQEAVNTRDTVIAEKISAAKGAITKQEKDKRLELARTEQEYRIDISAKLLAKELDQFSERERLYDLYMQLQRRSIELVKLASMAASLASECGTVATAANNIFWSFKKQIMFNMQHDFDYHIHKPDIEALLESLEARLQELKVESDKKSALEDRIRGFEGA